MSFKPIPNLSGTQANFTGNITSAGDLTVEGNITMGGANVLTGISSSDVTGALGFTPISAQTDDQTLDEVLAQGNTSSRHITAGGVTGSNGLRGQDVQIGVTDSAMIDTSAGDLEIGSAGGTTILGDTTISITNELGIGTTSPDYNLDIGGDTSSANNTIRMVQANNGTAIRIGAGGDSNDVNLLRVDGGTSVNKGESDSANFGFSLRYKGSGSGANNSLAFFADNSTAGSQIEALTILNDGKVGIGIASPEQELHVYQGTAKFESTDGNDVSLRLGRSDVANLWDFNHAGNDLRIYNSGGSGYDILFGVNSGGTSQSNKVGINTASPSHQLDVNGTFQAVGDATFDANVNAAGVITTGGNTAAEVMSWLHVGRMWTFNGLPNFSNDSGASAARSDGNVPALIQTGSAASRRAMAALIRNTYNDYGGFSGAGPDYSRAIGVSTKVAFFVGGEDSSIVRLLVGSPYTLGTYADEDPLSSHGFGVEFRRGSGSTTEWRVFAHNGTSLSASTFTSTGITHTTDPRTVAVYSDGAGNITAYTATYGSTSYTTATTTGGPTTTTGGSSTFTSIQVATNNSGYVSGAQAKLAFMGARFYAE